MYMYTVHLLMLGAHTHEGYGSLFVCLLPIYCCLRCLHNKMNIVPAGFTFQLRDFFKRFLSRLTASFVHFSMLKRPFSFLSVKQ